MNILEVRKEFEEELRRVKYPDKEQNERMAAVKEILSTDEGREAVAKAWVEASMTVLTPEEREEATQKHNLMKAFWADYLASSSCAALGMSDKPKSWFDGKEL